MTEDMKNRIDDLSTALMHLLSEKAEKELGVDADKLEKEQFMHDEVEFISNAQDVNTDVLHTAVSNWFLPASEKVDLISG